MTEQTNGEQGRAYFVSKAEYGIEVYYLLEYKDGEYTLLMGLFGESVEGLIESACSFMAENMYKSFKETGRVGWDTATMLTEEEFYKAIRR